MIHFIFSDIKHWLREIRIEKIETILNEKIETKKIKKKETND